MYELASSGEQKMTGQNLANREEARRVWRLNKKEGIPVLEALETANISKETYYSYKREHESDWENQLLSAKDLENRLEELSEELVDLREDAELVGERLDRAEDMTDAVKQVEDAVAAADSAESQAYRAERGLRQIEAELGVSIDPDDGEVLVSLEDVSDQQERLTNHLRSVTERVEELEETMRDEQQKRQEAHDKMRKKIEEVSDSGGLFS